MVEGLMLKLSFLFPLLLSLSSLSSPLQVTSSSPCHSVCAGSGLRTTADGLACLDGEFASTSQGSGFQACVECELGSTTVDPLNGATDVNWGLYNLRYAFSTCVFGFPTEKISVSTPCQVSCERLRGAIEHNLDTNTTVVEDLSYCNRPGFQDTVVINRCAKCYGRMDDVAYMANFLQALHIACLQPPRRSQPFPVTASTIFNATPIATPTPSSTTVPAPRKPPNLALVIALPVVFGVLILAGIVACCFYSARHRRHIMAERNRMRRIHEQQCPTFAPHQLQHQMQAQTPQFPKRGPAAAGPAYLSPILDQKENPYHQDVSPEASPQSPYPYHEPYSSADNAQHPSISPLPFDTSKIGPGPDQEKVHSLHDQYFPPPPPPKVPPSQLAMMQMQPLVPPYGDVQSLQGHHMETPSLGLPVPRGKRSMDIHHGPEMGHEHRQMDEGVVVYDRGSTRDTIPLQEYGTRDGSGRTRNDEQGGQSPQVFVNDPVYDHDVKHTS